MYKVTQSLGMLLACALIFLTATPALSAGEPVGKLADFSGDVIIKSQGSWAAQPTLNHPLYSDDKVVTRVGRATIIFNDGAIVKIENNSNLLINERVEEKGWFRKIRTVKRRLRLLLGKLSFVTGRSKNKRDTIFETATAVCGLRGTAGTLSIGYDSDGNEVNHIKFTDGEAAYTIGEFIFNSVAEDLPQEFADTSPVQRAVFAAKAAADQAKNATEMLARGEISDADAARALAEAAEKAFEEVKIQAQKVFENNPSAEVVDAAAKAIRDAEEAIQQAKTRREALEKGTEPPKPGEGTEGEGEAYEPPPGFDVNIPGDTGDLTGGCASCT